MAKVTTIVAEKGGVGKSPTSVHLAWAIARAFLAASGTPRKVLLVDADPQATTSLHCLGGGYESVPTERTLAHVLLAQQHVEPVPLDAEVPLFLLPAQGDLTTVEIELEGRLGRARPFQPHMRAMLEKFYSAFDLILIDTPGSASGLLAVMALVAADLAIVPTRTTMDSVDPMQKTLSLIEQLRAPGGFAPHLSVWGILVLQHDVRTGQHQGAWNYLQETYPDLLWPEPSRISVRYAEAMTEKADIREIDPRLGPFWDRIASSVLTRLGLSTEEGTGQ